MSEPVGDDGPIIGDFSYYEVYTVGGRVLNRLHTAMADVLDGWIPEVEGNDGEVGTGPHDAASEVLEQLVADGWRFTAPNGDEYPGGLTVSLVCPTCGLIGDGVHMNRNCTP